MTPRNRRATTVQRTSAEGAATLAAAAKRLSNWGRWGEQDQIGTLNLLDNAARTRGREAIVTGETYSLALSIDENGPTSKVSGRGLPRHTMSATGMQQPAGVQLGGSARFTDDAIDMPLQSTTQWDGLAHIFYDDLLYNGYPAHTVGENGATQAGIEHAADRLVGRAVLLDYAGPDASPRRQLIRAEDLDRLCDLAQVTVEPGDMVLVRTGSRIVYEETRSWKTFLKEQSGLAFDCLDWFHERGVASVACDNATVELAGVWDEYFVPFHMVAIRDMGLWLGEYWSLETIAQACRDDSRWTFLLSAPPLPIVGAVGSPVNPIAIR